MNLEHVLAAVGRMFPSINLNGAVQKAQEAVRGTPNSLDGVAATARNLGITEQSVREIYQKYGNTVQGRAVCSLLGTTPEALKADAETMLNGRGTPFQAPRRASHTPTRFPRLK